MIEFNAYVRNPLAPRIFVNNVGGIYRLEGGIIQATFVQQFRDPNFNTVEQASLLWPEAHWHAYGDMLQWVQREIERGTFRGDIPQLRPN